MRMKFQIVLTVALVLIALLPTARASPISAQTGVDPFSRVTTLVADTGTSHSFAQSPTGDLNSDKHNRDVPEPSSMIPLLVVMTGLWFFHRSWAIKPGK